MKHLFLTFVFLLCSYVVEAQENTQAYNQAIKTLKIVEEDIDKDLYAEKVLPYDTHKLVMVFPLRKGDDQEATFDLYVVVYDLSQKRIAQWYKGTDEYTSDAIRLGSLSIDTAKFILAEKVRAFGIRASYEGSSRVSTYYQETFSMFLPQEKSLKKILNQYVLVTANGEPAYNNCEGSWSEENRSLFIMDNKKTNGYFNIKDKITFKRTEANKECEDKVVKKTTKIVLLKYNGKEYKKEEKQ